MTDERKTSIETCVECGVYGSHFVNWAIDDEEHMEGDLYALEITSWVECSLCGCNHGWHTRNVTENRAD